MSKSTISIYVLLALLLGTNALWLQRLNAEQLVPSKPIEMHCTRTQEAAEIYDSVVLPMADAIAAAAKPRATKESIVHAANSAGFGTNPICMSAASVVAVRGIGLRFNDVGQLTGATVTHCPP